MSRTTTDGTNIRLSNQVKDRFDDLKPYRSMSADEFVDVLLDRWEGRR